MPSIHIITASTSGNTDYVADVLTEALHKHAPAISMMRQRAVVAKPEDLLRGNVLILGSGTWNTGGMEGQLNMYMDDLLFRRAANVDLKGKPVTFLSLGDERYFYPTRCTEHFVRWMKAAHGTLLLPPLVLVNEPYEQEERVRKWAEKLLVKLQVYSTAGSDHEARGGGGS